MSTQTRLNFEMDYKYIIFRLADEQNPKTFVYNVLTKEKEIVSGVNEQHILLGQIKWY